MDVQSGGAAEGRRPRWAVTPWPWADQAIGVATAGVLALGVLSATFVGEGGVNRSPDNWASEPLGRVETASAAPLADPLAGLLSPAPLVAPTGTFSTPTRTMGPASSGVPASIAAPSTRPSGAAPAPLSSLRTGPAATAAAPAPAPVAPPAIAQTPAPAAPSSPLPALPVLEPGSEEQPPVTVPTVVEQLVPAAVQSLLP